MQNSMKIAVRLCRTGGVDMTYMYCMRNHLFVACNDMYDILLIVKTHIYPHDTVSSNERCVFFCLFSLLLCPPVSFAQT